MALPSPGPWQMYAGGVSGPLTFNADTGVVSGTIISTSTLTISGYFDETSQTLSFIISDPLVTQGGYSGVAPAPFTLYTAQLIQVGSGASAYYLLVGSFSTIANGGAFSPVTWYAQYPAPTRIPPPPVSPVSPRSPRPPLVPRVPPHSPSSPRPP
jgi:hypothetical protein